MSHHDRVAAALWDLTDANPVDRAPNFLFKPTGAKVSWYKYIGRGMEIEGQLPYGFLSVCLDSLNQETTR